MTEFFDKKEEFLEVQLTEYGKYLLSMGKLRPAYYAFYDDEILYNTQFAGHTEEQNDADRRIRHETPNLKVIPTRTGAETRVERFLDKVSDSLATHNSDPSQNFEAFQQQAFIEKVNFSSYPIGTALMTTDKTAAWSIGALKNTIDSTEEYIITNPSSSFADINNGVITRVPQLNIDVNYQTFYRQGLIGNDAISEYLPGAPETNIYLALREDYLVLEILEGNTNFEKENFDVEVYFMSEMSGSSGSPTTTLEQLAYIEDQMSAPNYLNNPETNIGNVEYYFNLYLDEDIPTNMLQEAGIEMDDLTSNSTRSRFNRDLYVSTEDEEAC
tara:strand:- start:11002 stop:11985 length:984 start_codon:yes stop_codon:yes gene_type:complete